MRLPLSVYRSRIGVQWADPSVRPSCVVTPRYSRWFMDGRSAPLSRPRKGWDSKMYHQILSRQESEKASLGLSHPWRGGRGGVCNTPLPIRQEERLPLWLSCPWRGGLWGVCNTPLRIRQEKRSPLGLSRPWRGGRGVDVFATLSIRQEERATLGLSWLWRGGLGGVCNTPLPCRKEEGSALGLSRPRKEWDLKMYPLTLCRHESERATLELFRPWWGGRWADVFAPLRIRKEERVPLGLSRPRKGWDSKMYPLTLSRHESEKATLWLSRSWRGGRGADIFATCLYSFLVTITPRLTFHF